MKKVIFAAALMLGLSSTAFANQYYLEGFGGLTVNPDLGYDDSDFEMDTGYNVGGAFGTTVNEFDVEGEIFYTESDYEGYNSNVNALSVMVNLVYGFPVANTVEGYVGAGLGGVNVEYDGGSNFSSFTGDEWVFGGQIFGGILVPVGENISLFGEYRYQHAADAEIQGLDVEYRGHHFSVGVRATF